MRRHLRSRPCLVALLAAAPLLAVTPATGPDPASAASRLRRDAFNRKSIIDAYDKVGRKDPKWDPTARKLLQLAVDGGLSLGSGWVRLGFGSHDPNLDWRISLLGKQALDAGCDDPMVAFHYLRSNRALEQSDEERNRCVHILAKYVPDPDCAYSPLFKVYALAELAVAYNPPFSVKNEKLQPLVRELVDAAYKNIPPMLADPDVPAVEAAAICADLTDAAAVVDGDRKISYQTVSDLFKKSYPNSPIRDYFEGVVYTRYAWDARGAGWASEVTDEGWRLMRERVDAARNALDRALQKDPHMVQASLQMLDVQLLLGEGRGEMEKWFQRAITDDPNSYAAYREKLFFLSPKWHGSVEDQLAFGRTCLATQRWESRIPLLLLQGYGHIVEARYRELFKGGTSMEASRKAADQARAEYYRSTPEVWPDIQNLYTGLLAWNPKADYDRTDYARLAAMCGHPEVAQQQLEILGSDAAYTAPKNLHKFRALVRTALERANEAVQPAHE